MLYKQIEQLNAMLQESRRIVFFGGAGVSTASGIPDFRSQDGLYATKYDYPPEIILSHSFFKCHTEKFYFFYKEKMIFESAQPNVVHKKLAEWESRGILNCIITQNIDGLHQKADSQKVLELHGSVYRNRCLQCGKFYELDSILKTEGLPLCSCGGLIKPEVVLYEEPLAPAVIAQAVEAIRHADMLLIGGTSLKVYPAAGLIRYFRGKYLVLINKEKTFTEQFVNLFVEGNLTEVFTKLH